jgi:hypothetical protein
MRNRTRSLLAALVAVVSLAAASGCNGSTGPSSQARPTPLTSPTPTPTVTVTPKPKPKPPPPADACYRLGYTQALAPTNPARPVPCSGRHTAVTFFVGSYDPRLAVDGDQVHRIESTVCPRRFAAYVGGSLEARRLSLLRTVWFTPTADQAALGAHWFQCVAIALQGSRHLALLDGPVQGTLDQQAGQDHYALCGTAEPGTSGFQQRICALPHSWKALRTVPFPPGPYPGADQVKAAGQTPCQDAGRVAASDPLDYQWSYQWPTLQQWRAGQTWGTCWAPS